jgi:hypothetical protein
MFAHHFWITQSCPSVGTVGTIQTLAPHQLSTKHKLCKFLNKHVQDATVNRYGHTFESRTIFTLDGYKLGVFRIPPKNRRPDGQVIFMQHGVFETAMSWLSLGNDSLGERVIASIILKKLFFSFQVIRCGLRCLVRKLPRNNLFKRTQTFQRFQPRILGFQVLLFFCLKSRNCILF